MNTERAAASRDIGDGLCPEWLVRKQPGHLINHNNEAWAVLGEVKLGPVGALCGREDSLSSRHLGTQASQRSTAGLGSQVSHPADGVGQTLQWGESRAALEINQHTDHTLWRIVIGQ
jgi:hypothetical protein